MTQEAQSTPETPADSTLAIDTGTEHPVVLFDGVCNLCDSSVQFMIAHDPTSFFRFTSLQSEAGQRILKRYNLPTEDFGSVVLVENNRVHQHSSAALRIARHLNGAWPAFFGLIVVPWFIRDLVYNFIAAHRYKWFGKKEMCMMPTPELRARFLK